MIRIILVFIGLYMSFAFTARADICGLLEVANGDLLEIRSGKLYSMDEVQLAEVVPGTKKVLLSLATGSVSIERAVNKLKKKVIQFTYQPLNGKKQSVSKDLKNSLAFFDAEARNFVFIDLAEHLVSRASLPEGSAKLKFKVRYEEFFSRDRC